jgi:hypothetical protein
MVIFKLIFNETVYECISQYWHGNTEKKICTQN